MEIQTRQPDPEKIPHHIAIIMDGNGRWAKERGMLRAAGHQAGMEALREIVRKSAQLGVRVLTVYAFSTENWKRPQDEVGGIFKLLVRYCQTELEDLNRNHVRVDVLGETDMLPKDARESLQKALQATESNTGMQFLIALNYGARREILLAAQQLAADVKNGSLQEIREEDLSARLFTAKASYPDPDLIIRTGGEKRLSNFLLWQGAYSELVFRDTLWPDFAPEDLVDCICEYQQRDRRYGGLSK